MNSEWLLQAVIFIGIMAVLSFVGTWIVNTSCFYKELHSQPTRGRYPVIDGLRGHLALGVFVTHAQVQRNFYRIGKWQADPSLFFRIGPTAVMFFFFITAFLFWSKVIAKKGSVAPLQLYWNRFLRLAPLYWFALAITVCIVVIESRFHHYVGFRDLFWQLIDAASLGIIRWSEINRISVIPITAGVTWTLYFEWWFYLLLPVLGFIAYKIRPRNFLLLAGMLALAALAIRPWDDSDQEVTRSCLRFLGGIVVAHIAHRWDFTWVVSPKGGGRFGAIIIVLLAVCLYTAEMRIGIAVGVLTFICFVNGADVFGVFTSKGAWILGTASYSIYLLHGMVLFVTLKIINHFFPINSISTAVYWSIILGCGIVVVLLAILTYRYIEHPFIVWAHSRKAREQREAVCVDTKG